MSIAAAPPIVPAAEVAVAALKRPSARIEGTVLRVHRRARGVVSIEGSGLHKVGRGEVTTATFAGTTYRGELVAIAPTRAILHISSNRADHGISHA